MAEIDEAAATKLARTEQKQPPATAETKGEATPSLVAEGPEDRGTWSKGAGGRKDAKRSCAGCGAPEKIIEYGGLKLSNMGTFLGFAEKASFAKACASKDRALLESAAEIRTLRNLGVTQAEEIDRLKAEVERRAGFRGTLGYFLTAEVGG